MYYVQPFSLSIEIENESDNDASTSDTSDISLDALTLSSSTLLHYTVHAAT